MEIKIDAMHHPRVEFQFDGTQYALVGIDAQFYRAEAHSGNMLIDLGDRSIDYQSDECTKIVDEDGFFKAVEDAVCDEFDRMACIGMLKRNIEITERKIETICDTISKQQQDLDIQKSMLEKLRVHLRMREEPQLTLSTAMAMAKNVSRWKASVPLAPLWSLIDCVDDMREHTPKIIDLMHASGELFAGTDFIERLRKVSSDGDLMAFEDVVEAITDYADANNIWITG